MYRESPLTREELLKLIRINAINRNELLNTFIQLLNSTNANTYFSIDGRWGSGKTVFIRQLEILNYLSLDAPTSQSLLTEGELNERTLEDFQNKYLAYYYNAWQNDDHSDPIQSLLFNLIHDYQVKDDLKKKAKSVSTEVVRYSLISGIKTLSKGFVDLESLRKLHTVKSLVEDITTTAERKDAVSNIISGILPENKKLLFLIDELDRCAPTFAVSMLEAIKHYYDNDNIIFVLSTNNMQLAHTIRKYYGADFEGTRYLNKFYDLVIDLPEIDRKAYISKHLKRKDDSYWHTIVPARITDVLNMTMREITRYYSSLDVISRYLTAQANWSSRIPDITKYLFVPLALALKITDTNQYTSFRTGKGTDILREVCSQEDVLRRIAVGYVKDESKNNPQDQIEAIVNTYNELFARPGRDTDYEITEVRKRFHEVIALINTTGKIDE